MGYSLPQITEVLSKTDKTLYKVGAIAYENMFSELSESLDYERDIIFVYKKAVEWADDFYVGDVRTDAIVERLSLKISIYDYGSLNPIYSGALSITNALPGEYYLYQLGDVNITNLQNNQVLTYNSVLGMWVNSGGNTAVRTNLSFTATLNQTTFITSAPFTAGLLDVYLNGVKLNSSNYSTFGEYSITLYDGCLADDIIDVIIYGTSTSILDLSSYVLKSTTITINGVTYDLSTNRTWTIDALPSQSGNSGKYLTTDGSIASWGTISLTGYVPYTGATGAVSLGLYGLTAGTLTLQAQALNSSTYKITQQMASNDYWSIYGFASVADYGDLYFELQDNAAFADGQRFRFHYGNASSGTPKDILLMDYNSATFDGDVNLGVHRISAQNATIASSGSGDTATLNHTSGSGIGLNITKGGNGEGLYVNKTSGSGNAATIIGTLNATNLVKNGGTSAQILAADGSVITAGTNITISGGTISASGGGGSMAIGGAITSATAGSVLFAGASGVLQQDNANFFWDDTNNRLGIGTNSPSSTLDIVHNDNSYTAGIFIKNINTGTQALSGIGLKDSANNVVGLMSYDSINFSNTAFQNAIIFQSTRNSKLGFVANSGSVGGGAQDIFFSTFGNNATYQLQIKGSTGNVLINTNSDAGYRLDVNGTAMFRNVVNVQGTTATDGGQLGSELTTTGSGTNWTGTSFATGYTHTPGSTVALTTTLAATLNDYYYISFTITSHVAGTISFSFGGYTSSNFFTNTNFSIIATATTVFSITPLSTFNATVQVSIKKVTAGAATIILRNSSATITNEIRASSINSQTFLGVQAGTLSLNTSTNLVGIGYQALKNNVTGISNLAIGSSALSSNVYSNSNVAIGSASLQANYAGSGNTAIGGNSLYQNTIGSNNTVIGNFVMPANLTGSSNLALSKNALNANSSGSYNVALGEESLRGNVSGSYNVGIGIFAGGYSAGGGSNAITNNSIYIGYNSMALANNQTNQIVIGYNETGLGSNTTIIGNSSTITTALRGRLLLGTTTDSGLYQLDVNGTARVSGDALVNGMTVGKGTNSLLRNTAVGVSALLGLNVGASFNDNTAIGYESLKTNTTGHSNTAIGSGSLTLQTTATHNTAIGAQSLTSLTTGSNNTAIGSQSLFKVTTGSNNIGIGYNANTNTTTASNNIGIGRDTLFSTTSGADNVAIGRDSLRGNIVGNRNLAIGGLACLQSNTGNYNIGLGAYSLEVLNSGSNNISIGDGALNTTTTGSSNVAVGLDAARRISGGGNNTITNNSIFIGQDTRPLAISQTNQIVIGDTAIGAGSNSVTLGNTSITKTILRGTLNAANLPTSATGLSAGDIWNDAGTLKIV